MIFVFVICILYFNSQVGFVIMAIAMFMMGCEMDAAAVKLPFPQMLNSPVEIGLKS